MTSEPVRLLEDPSAAAALRDDLLHAARAEVQGLDVAAGLVALQKATATVTSSTTAVAGTSLLAKLGIGAAGVTAGAVALWLGLGGGGPQAAPPLDEPVDVRDRRVPEHPEPLRDAAPRPQPNAGAAMPAPPSALAPTAAELPVAELPVAHAPALEPTPATPVSRRKADRALEKRARPASPAIDGVLREAKLVAKARSNLAHDPARALALTEAAERDFPEGQLVEERRALAIRALVGLGRLDEANARAEPFLAEYGRGAHAAAVRRALEDPSTP